MGLIGSRGVVMSSLSVHAWSLTIAVTSCMIATVVVVVLSCLLQMHHFSMMHLEPRSRTRRLFVDTPSWCDGFTTTPQKPTEDDVHDEAVVLVGCVSVAVEALFFDDTVIRCLCCLAVGAEELLVDEAEVADVACRYVSVEALKENDVQVVIVDCCPDGVEALPFDDVADR